MRRLQAPPVANKAWNSPRAGTTSNPVTATRDDYSVDGNYSPEDGDSGADPAQLFAQRVQDRSIGLKDVPKWLSRDAIQYSSGSQSVSTSGQSGAGS